MLDPFVRLRGDSVHGKMGVSDSELQYLRYWLGAIALFEVPEIVGYLLQNKPLAGFFSTLKNDRPEKRLWCMVLTFLVLARVQAVVHPTAPGVMANCAAVHVLEAVVFGYEYLKHNSNGNAPIFAIILANAVWFTSVAMRL